MTGSLLGGFDNAMAGLTADEVERAAGERSVDQPASTPAEVVEASGAAPQRELDPRSLALASRLLGVDRPDGAADAESGEHQAGKMRLVVVPTGVVHELPVDPTRGVVIGRSGAGASSDDVYLAVELAVVSRQHCRIERSSRGVALSDLGSANGTFVVREGDIHPVATEPFDLQVGDLITTANGACAMARIESATS